MSREEIMAAAAELGRMIAQDEQVIRLGQLNEQYEQSEELQTLMTEYNAQNQVLTMEYGKQERDEEMISLVQQRINELYNTISKHPIIAAYNEAQDKVNALMSAVNGEIQFGMTGKRPQEGCTHDCSTCSGCH